MANIQLLQGTEKIKDSYGKINTSLINLNNNKLEKSGDTMTGPLEIKSTFPVLKLAELADNLSSWVMYDSGSFYVQLRDSAGNWVRDLLRLSGDGLIQLVGNQTMWHGGNNPVTLGGTGYQRLASGLIIQWGSGHTSAGSLSVTLPIAYPSNHLITIPVAETGDVTANLTTASYTTSGVTILCSNAVENIFVRWYSIGY